MKNTSLWVVGAVILAGIIGSTSHGSAISDTQDVIPTVEVTATQIDYPTLNPTSIPTQIPTYTPVPTIFVPSVSTTCSSASAVCGDGSCSYSAHRQGTCSHHGGVEKWL